MIAAYNSLPSFFQRYEQEKVPSLTNGPKIVELNLRAGGSGITQLMDASTNQKFGLSYVEMCLGKELNKPLFKKGASWHSILPVKSGLIKKCLLRTRSRVLERMRIGNLNLLVKLVRTMVRILAGWRR